MFQLVVLLGAVAVAAGAPGYLHSAVIPLATSHSSRIDVHSKPIITYAAPLLHHAPIVKTILPAPIIKTIVAAPILHGGISHSSRYDIHPSPISYGLGHGYGGYGSYGHGGYGGYGGYGHLGYGGFGLGGYGGHHGYGHY